MSTRICSLGECNSRHYGLELCRNHYDERRRRHRGILRRRAPGICTFKDCGRKHNDHGLCPTHSNQRRAGKPLTPIHRYDPNKKCSFKNCKNKHRTRELCSTHYEQQRTGKPLTIINSSSLRPLRPEEVPKQLRSAFGFGTQKIKRSKSGSNLHITRTCQKCKQQKDVFVSTVRGALEAGVLTGKCQRCPPDGINHAKWKGGRNRTPQGYILIHIRTHQPSANKNGYALEHRLVMEQKLGRSLTTGETVHHINGIKDDNRPENLESWVGAQPSGIRAEDAPHCSTCVCNTHPSGEDLKEAQEKAFTHSLP